MLQSWYSIILGALQNLLQGFLSFIPTLIGTIIVLVIGWFISVAVGKLVTKILDLFRINQLFAKGDWDEALEKAGIKANVTGFFGAIVKWILVLVFLVAASDILGFSQFANFLNSVLAYLPNVVIAALIFVATVIVIEIIEKVLVVGLQKFSPSSTQMVSAITKWAIWIFAILAILLQLGVARALVETLFTGLVAMLAIAAGLAFGLGGKDVAGEALQNLRKKLRGQ